MKNIKRIPIPMIEVNITSWLQTEDEKPLLRVLVVTLNPYEFRNLQTEIARGEREGNITFRYFNAENKIEKGAINADGSLSSPCSALSIEADYQFELLQIKNR